MDLASGIKSTCFDEFMRVDLASNSTRTILTDDKRVATPPPVSRTAFAVGLGRQRVAQRGPIARHTAADIKETRPGMY